MVGTTTDLRVQDEVEFEIMTDRDNRKVATRISRLKKGTINFESFSPERVNGEGTAVVLFSFIKPKSDENV